jgi:molecular chaperone DnaK (HSP70)
MSIDNHFLGKMLLVDLTPAPAGEVEFDVTFEIDANGILKVTAEEIKTKKSV